MSNAAERFICATCHKINFQDLLQNPRMRSYLNDPPGQTKYLIQYTKGCAVCEMLLRSDNGVQELRSYSTRENCPWLDELLDAVDSVLLVVGQPDKYFRRDDMLDYTFCAEADERREIPELEFGQFQPIPESWNVQSAKLWLDVCRNYHNDCCNLTENGTSVTGMNLIDCDDLIVMQADPAARWVALSYVWGDSPVEISAAPRRSFWNGSPLPEDLPLTIRDAICVTRSLGYKYLWVDEYCIDQNDSNSKIDQIGKMDHIYRQSEVTIVAAAGVNKHHGLPGVSKKRSQNGFVNIEDIIIFSQGLNPILNIQMSKWFSRAWTFQEGVLPIRVLVFTEHQASYYCRTRPWMEGLYGPGHSTNRRRLESPNVNVVLFPHGQGNGLSGQQTTDWNYLQELFEEYASRRISFESDTLKACLGVLLDIRRTRSHAFTLCGLPLIRRKVANHGSLAVSAEYTVSTALSWDGVGHNQRKTMFPSWTWAGWHDSICFLHHDEEGLSWNSILTQVRLETECGGILDLSRVPRDSGRCDKEDNKVYQRMLDTVISIHFRAPMLSASHIMEAPSDVDDRYPWEDFIVGERKFQRDPRWVIPPPEILMTLRQNVESGFWSCLILGSQIVDQDGRDYYNRFVLVVQWESARVTAERIGGFVLTSDMQTEKDLGALENDAQWCGVKLI